MPEICQLVFRSDKMTVTLKNAKRVIGIKQVTKAVKNDLAKCVYIADDADDRVLSSFKRALYD